MGRVAIALIAGLIVGISVSRAGIPWLSRGVALLEPVGSIWVNAIRMTSVPLVVALLLGAVARGGESYSVGRLGGIAGPAIGGSLLAFGLPPKQIFLCACAPALIAATCTFLLTMKAARQREVIAAAPQARTA